MIRVLLADDQAILRRGLKQFLKQATDIAIVGEAEDYAQIMRTLRETSVDVLLLDIGLPTKSGIEVLQEVRKQMREVRVLMLTMHTENSYALQSLRAGAAGYITKDSTPEQLIAAIRHVAAGKKYITPEVGMALAEQIDAGSDEARHEQLSDREFATLQLIACGKPLSVIAKEFGISPKTVSVYRARLLEKMKLKNNAELTHYALSHKLT